MNLISRYLFRQIALPVAAACAALCGIGILSQSLNQLEVIVERGQSAWVMMKLTLLATPQLLGVVLPIGVLVGGLMALTRLQREQELTACFAGGLSRWRVIAPAMRLAVMVAVFSLFVSLYIQPAAQREARETAFAIRTDLASLLVQEGQFVQAGGGLTVYVQQIEQSGLIRNLFVHIKDGDEVTTWDATTARFTRIDGAPALLMGPGSMQQFSNRDVLNFLSFDEYAFDLTPFTGSEEVLAFRESDLWLSELLRPSADMLERTGSGPELLAEAHARIASPLYALTAMALALAAVLGGQFRRTGYGGRVASAAAAFLVARVAGYGVVAASAWNVWLAPLQYLIPLGVTVLALRMVFRQSSPIARVKRAVTALPRPRMVGSGS
ncbi:MAG: lipopolysaccharide export system permease protein [Brevundimonas sp.]|jgi:lipopolysaccharide export system permease protein|uniref:LptF/LptG family permease n=1 Tax=Brevundimonas sp. TaxID=1871086 RepID=UPI0039E4EB4F